MTRSFQTVPDRRIATLALLLPWVLAGCGGDADAGDATRTDSAGVEIVMNTGEDRSLGWTFTPTLVLGGKDEGPEAFYDLWSGGIGTDSSGNLYILDRGNFRVVSFAADGSHRWTAGREGGGPGEFKFPLRLTVFPAGTVEVADMGGPKFERFTTDGERVDAERMEGGFTTTYARTPMGLLVERQRFGRDEQPSRFLGLVTGDADTTVLVELPLPERTEITFEGCPIRLRMGPLLEPDLEWATSGRRLLVNGEPAYAISVYEGDSLVASIRRAITPRETTMELAVAELPNGFTVGIGGGGRQCEMSAEEAVEKRGYAPEVPTIRGLLIAPDGTIWVQRGRETDERAPFDLFTADGRYIGTLASAPAPDAFMPNGDVVSLEKDELDLQRVMVYGVGRTERP